MRGRAQPAVLAAPAARREPTGARRMEILGAAAAVFRERGYQNTSMREIADRAGILSGSLYHHFSSKDALYAEMHGLALTRAAEIIAAAAEQFHDPWEQLEAACIQHLELQVAPNSETMPLMNELPRVNPALRDELVRQRDRFETLYRRLVEALPLQPDVDRCLYRTLLLTMLNAVPAWYRPGLRSTADIARQTLRLFRSGGDPPSYVTNDMSNLTYGPSKG